MIKRIDLSVAIPFLIFTGVWGSTWIIIRDQLGTVPPQWSVAYRFIVAAAAMALVAKWKGERLKLDCAGYWAAAVLGFTQFCVNFNGVYLAEQHITSGVVATFFALLLIPSSLLAWLLLGHRPTRQFVLSSIIAITGIGMLFTHELRDRTSGFDAMLFGLGLTLIAMLGAAFANVFQALPRVKTYPLFSLIAWSMAFGAIIDTILAFAIAGPPVLDYRPGYWVGLLYLALAASALTFSLYYPVVRKIGPGKAAYSSVLVPIIAMGLSTAFEGYRWTPFAAGGALLALGGMVGALSRGRPVVAPPDAA